MLSVVQYGAARLAYCLDEIKCKYSDEGKSNMRKEIIQTSRIIENYAKNHIEAATGPGSYITK